MSDIKNENDNLKDFPNYNKNKFDQVFPGIRERDEKIASLITTIESQKEKITDLESLIEWWEERVSEAKCMAEATDKENIELKRQVESQKEEIEKWREFGKVTVQWYKDNDWPIKAIDVQAKVDWISYTPTLCEIEKQAEHWQEGDK